MNTALATLLEQLKAASGKAKLAAAGVVVASAAILAVAGAVATRPHYTLLYAELSERDSATAQRALAEAGIDFRVSQPPGPYFIHVDEAREFAALRAVALSGALERPERGILSGASGAATVFVSSSERSQIVQKRYWQEAEKMLESFDFVTQAEVRTNLPSGSPFADERPKSGSVALTIAPGTLLSKQQKLNIANIVSFYLDVDPSRLVVTNQFGESLWDPDSALEDGAEPGSLFEHAELYNQSMARQAMDLLDMAYGAGRTQVRVVTEWDHDRRATVSKEPDAKVVRESQTTKSETPSSSRTPGGAPGVDSNAAAAFGSEVASSSAQDPGAATSKEERVLYDVGVTTEHTLHVGPVLRRLHVSLLVDEALASELGSEPFEQLVGVVQSAVGYDAERGDVFQVGRAPFAALKPELDANGQPIESPAPEGGGLHPALELLLERGVEIAAAIAFLVVLLRVLKSESRAGRAAAARAEGQQSGKSPWSSARSIAAMGGGETAIDSDLLLLHQVEHLVKSDPERVGKILSRWAREDATAKV